MTVLIFFFALLLYLFAPNSYDYWWCLACAVIFLLDCFIVIRKDRHNNRNALINFNIIFLMAFGVVVYVFPLFVQTNSNITSYLRFSVYSDSVITKTTALSTLAICSYIMAYGRSITHNTVLFRKKVAYVLPRSAYRFLDILMIIFTLLLILNALFFVVRHGSAVNNISTNTYIYNIQKCILYLSLVTKCAQFGDRYAGNFRTFIQQNSILVICSIITTAIYLYVGDRGYVITIGLTLLFAICNYVRNLRATSIIPIILVAVVFMFSIGQLRKGESSLQEGGLESFYDASSDLIKDEDTNVLTMLYDLIVVAPVSYITYEYSEQYNGFVYPGRILTILVAPVPLLPTFFSSLLYSKTASDLSTGTIITDFYANNLRHTFYGGLGTQVVTDIYISWGVLGVIIAFLLFGHLMGASNLYKRTNINALIVQFVMVGVALYTPRSALYSEYRTIVWMIFLLWIIRNLFCMKKQPLQII